MAINRVCNISYRCIYLLALEKNTDFHARYGLFISMFNRGGVFPEVLILTQRDDIRRPFGRFLVRDGVMSAHVTGRYIKILSRLFWHCYDSHCSIS